MPDSLRVELRAVPALPRAGEWFLLVVDLIDGPPSDTLRVTFEKHRVAVDQSGTHVLCPIEMGYFDDGSLSPIDITTPDTAGVSRVRVLPNAQNPQCPPHPPGSHARDVPGMDVKFPDWLIFTAFVSHGTTLVAKTQAAVTIQPAAAQMQASPVKRDS
jgi:hypothetical protein